MLENLKNQILDATTIYDEDLVNFRIFNEDEIFVSLYEVGVILEVDIHNECVLLSNEFGGYKLTSDRLREVHKVIEVLEDNLEVFKQLDYELV